MRPHRLAQHLPAFGIEPWVLTVEEPFAESLDPNLGHDGVPAERIVRTPVAPTVRDTVLGLWRRARSPDKLAVGGGPSAQGEMDSRGDVRLRRSALREWALFWLALPDLQIGWYRPAVKAGGELLGRTPFDAIVSTSPPRVTHLVAAHLAAARRLPWVMDFRDPWYTDWFARGDSPVMRTFQQWLLRRTARHALGLVANTPRLLKEFEERHLRGPVLRACIPNGFTLDHDNGRRADERPDRFTIGHFGQIMRRRTGVPFLHGLRKWLDLRRLEGDPVRVTFVGSGFGEEQRVSRLLGLDAIVQFEGVVPRSQALDRMRQQWVLLLLATNQPLQVPGKAYEYLATGRRVLALTEPDGATADLLEGVPGCAVTDGPDGVVGVLEHFWQEYEARSAACFDRGGILAEGTYERRAEAFARLLREVVDLEKKSLS